MSDWVAGPCSNQVCGGLGTLTLKRTIVRPQGPGGAPCPVVNEIDGVECKGSCGMYIKYLCWTPFTVSHHYILQRF